jgi:hypothetical protein
MPMLPEKESDTITKRAQAVAAMGLVKRAGDHFIIGAPSIRGQRGPHHVRRNPSGKVCCTCQEFAEATKTNPGFRCEHILAVKFSLSTAGDGSTTPAPASGPAPATQFSSPAAAQDAALPTHHLPDNPSTSAAIKTTTRPSFSEILSQLGTPLPSDLVKQRAGWRDHRGTQHFVDYVEWHTVADLLDQVAPDWSHAVRAITPIGDLVAITAAITIHGITREGVGTGPAESETGIKKAEHDALKRAAVKFGVARELYKHADEDDTPTPCAAKAPLPRDPLAKTLADLITPKQLVTIRALAQTQGLAAESECAKLYGCQLEELARPAASAFINHLKSRHLPQAEAETTPQQWRQAG